MSNRVKSLEIRNEVIKLIKEKFEINFGYSYNDLYRIKDNGLVRRLKGNLYKNGEDRWFYYFNKDNNCKEFNELVLKIDNFVKELNYEGFKIRLKKKVNCIDERDRYYYEKNSNEVVSMKEFREIVKNREKEMILSIVFKDI
jgi:hypothetical protein